MKENKKYFNSSPKRSARYKETHLADFRSERDVEVGKLWMDEFVSAACYYRAIAIDWSIWDARFFAGAFDPEALAKRRAYKKWAEMLLHPELKSPTLGEPIYHARLYLDRLRIMCGYDVIDHLKSRFTDSYRGSSPYIKDFQHTESWRDANQCLQLCDLLTGSIYRAMVPPGQGHKSEMCDYVARSLGPLKILSLRPQFWRQYGDSVAKHFPKFSVWHWKPTQESRKKRRMR